MKNRELIAVVSPGGTPQLEWAAAEGPIAGSAGPLQNEIFERFTSEPDSWLLFLAFCDKDAPLSPSLAYWRDFGGLFARGVSRTPDLEILRDRADIVFDADEIRKMAEGAPLMTGSEYLGEEALKAQWVGLQQAFSRTAAAFDGSMEAFVRTYSPDVHLVGRVFFHLVENKTGEAPFAFLATYSTRLDDQGQSRHLPLKHALEEYGEDNEKLLELLSTVYRAAEESELATELLESGGLFHPLAWSARQAFDFFKEVSIYEAAGVLCRIPNWWRGAASGPRLNISLGDVKPSRVGMDALLNFNASLYIGDAEISEKEARRLLNESEGLAFIKNKWVAVDPEKLRETLDLYDRAREMMEKEGWTLRDALRFQLNPEKLLGESADAANIGVSAGKWMSSVLEKLRDPAEIQPVKTDRRFKATLREYQRKGLSWLHFLHSLRFGACLADDMGLGKTVQLLAFLNVARKSNGKRASLLVIPASLIGNWVNEIRRFSPTLRFFVAHPEAHRPRKVKPLDDKAIDRQDLIITTYALAQRYEWLADHRWAYVILDEAQAIKNPGTKQTRAVKKLRADNRIIMTGTPIENRIGDLWSLFDFLNPGLLGTVKEFKAFTKKLRNDPSGCARLRRLISPYILRRLKTDKTVISDLPDKVEMKTYAPLTKKQVVLYKDLVRRLEEIVENVEGIKRRGLILSSLMKFKQICNHPDQYLGSGDYEERHGGKFSRLREICETIRAKREKALVFTQFKEMTRPLADFLAGVFEREGLVMHGGTPVGKRKKLVEKFQRPEYTPFMVLSLKVGGVGLNLTEANHVIHFDRWWNPAVENQATDRVFRIGQKKNVLVHKFLTRGTVEEKIDEMLEDKAKLSRDVISDAGEKWITEMENDELLEMFRLTL
ncbi:MAG: DEAD/DEAH box helicase [Desulfobacterales bacterium]|nr:DEAD/DEAH box helicase [Desulfobacterales bacterium]